MTASGRPKGGSWTTWASALNTASASRPQKLTICHSFFMSDSLPNLDHVIKERVGHFQKLVRHTVRHNDDVAFGDLARLPVADARSPQFVRRGLFGIHGFTAGDERRRSLHHVDHVNVFGVNLGLAGLFAAAGVDHVVPSIAAVE